MPASYAADCAFGFSNQQTMKQILDAYFGGNHIEQPRYAKWDFISDDGKRFIEVKSRRCAHDTYPTALVGRNKVSIAESDTDQSHSYYFAYQYTDGAFIVQYDPTLFSSFVCEPFQRGGRAGIVDRSVDTYHIPHNNLSKINI